MKTNGGSRDALHPSEAISFGICFQLLEVRGELQQKSPLPLSLCQKTHHSWPGQPLRVDPLLMATMPCGGL